MFILFRGQFLTASRGLERLNTTYETGDLTVQTSTRCGLESDRTAGRQNESNCNKDDRNECVSVCCRVPKLI